MSSPGLTVVIPVYNEEGAVADTVRHLDEILGASAFADCHEVLVVDDGSTDGTAAELESCASSPSVTVIHHPVNRGYGTALKTGIRRARYDLVAITDADGTYPNERIPELAARIEAGFDMVVGARTGDVVKIPLVRKPAKWVLNQLANYLAGMKIPDLNSGLRVMKKPVVQKFEHILPAGYSFTTTITLALLTSHYLVEYVPVDYARRVGKSKFHPIKDTWNMGVLILKTVMYFKPLKVFIPAAAIVAGLGFAAFLYSYLWMPRVLDMTLLVSLMTAVQLTAIGLLADLIDKRSLR